MSKKNINSSGAPRAERKPAVATSEAQSDQVVPETADETVSVVDVKADAPDGGTLAAPDAATQAVGVVPAAGSGADPVIARAAPYSARKSGTFLSKPGPNDTWIDSPLANFTAWITADALLDDGSGEQVRHYRLRVETQDGRIREISVPAADFGSPKWVDLKLGAGARVIPGAGYAFLPDAIKALSAVNGVPEERSVAHLGYTTHSGGSVFVSADAVICGPAVDASNLLLDLADAAKGFSLPEPPTGTALRAALAASARVLDMGPLETMLPLWLAAYRPALPVPPPAYALWLYGLTGTFKSAAAGVIQAHFGSSWSGSKLPANFLSTLTSTEGVAHLAKNMLVVADDAQADDTKSRQELQRTVARLVRGQGNMSSRHRNTSDLRQRPARDPRCAIIITAEKLPPGHSINARLVLVHVGPKAIDAAKLTGAQKDARDGLLGGAMSGFIGWILAQGTDQMAAQFAQHSAASRADIAAALAASKGHARTPDALADLLTTAHAVLGFFKTHGVALPFDAAQARDILLGTGAAQAVEQTGNDPVSEFRAALSELLRTARARIAERATGAEPKADRARWGWPTSGLPVGPIIGYADIDEAASRVALPDRIWLVPNAAWTEASDYYARSGDGLDATSRSIWVSLADAGLVKRGKGQMAETQKVCGKTARVVDCATRIVFADDEVFNEETASILAHGLGTGRAAGHVSGQNGASPAARGQALEKGDIPFDVPSGVPDAISVEDEAAAIFGPAAGNA